MNDIFNLQENGNNHRSIARIRKAFRKNLSKAGATLLFVPGEENLESLKEEIDGEVLVLPLDVTSERSVAEFYFCRRENRYSRYIDK